ncbi:RND superfamily putative drug exporter [Amycolatopsis lexingtonensis]|uniref:RND superfamily putative drug exporter n=1 Tax=Amycolatopsis lexingtonensis TaxID=218822 RepID=A0ABR9IC89_9PSEU|nr:MMPL family transporter [Amycolatopsis lexingtonensis]MBE1500800.1 RND superfamily putative drug exporter [Amycolatopsis lexingtonensis]
MLPASTSAPLVERVADWSARHRAAAILGWLALVAFAWAAGTFLPGTDARSSPAGDAGTGQAVLDRQATREPFWENVLVPREATAVVTDLVTTLTASGAVADVRSPLDDPDRVSADGRSGLVSFRITGTGTEIRAHLATATAAVGTVAARHPDARLAQAGDLSVSGAVDRSIKEDIGRSEARSLPLTALILLVVFGSLVAAAVPVLLAGTTVVAAFGILSVVDNWIPVNSATSAMTLLIGMAVGVDYSLFFLRRAREERAHGVEESIRIAARTSGHVIVVSGLTVVLCVTGLLFTGLDNLRGLTVSTILVVGLAVLAAVTVLPATLSLLGTGIDRVRVPWLGKRRTRSRFWAAVAGVVTRRPALWSGLAAALLVLLALPAFGIRLQDPAPTESLPRSIPVIDAAVRVQEAFPGITMPAHVVLWAEGGGPVDTPAVGRAIAELTAATPKPAVVVPVDQALVVRIPLGGSGNGEAADRTLTALRETLLPRTVGRVDGVGYAIAGRTAEAHDFTAQVLARAPYVFGFIMLLAFVLLLAVFRSVAVPAVSILLNLLSTGAAYGVLTLVFQDGFLAPLLGFTPYGGVLGWLPVFLFVLLFGLSTDYHVFILSRIRERRRAGSPAREAIVEGTASSSGVVTSAALIMTGVFGIFLSLAAIEYKMLGLGMAFAILLDATVVRGILLPAALALFGERLWRPDTVVSLNDQSRTFHLS